CVLGRRFDCRLHVGGGVVDRLAIGKRCVSVILDSLRNSWVERGNRTWRSVFQRFLQRWQVWELLNEGLIIVDRSQNRWEGSFRKGGLVFFIDDELDEVASRGLVLGVHIDAVVVATQGGNTNAVLANYWLYFDLACGCFSFLSIGVHVRPVDSESGIAFGKGQVGLFFGCCGGLTGDG